LQFTVLCHITNIKSEKNVVYLLPQLYTQKNTPDVEMKWKWRSTVSNSNSRCK